MFVDDNEFNARVNIETVLRAKQAWDKQATIDRGIADVVLYCQLQQPRLDGEIHSVQWTRHGPVGDLSECASLSEKSLQELVESPGCETPLG